MNNIFSTLVHQKSSGVIREFVLWCITCFVALMALIATAVGHGNAAWIFLMLFTIGLGVLTAFRLTAIAMLYSVCVFNLLTFLMHYIFLYSTYSYDSKSVLNLILFILLLLLAIAIVVCAFVQFFTRYHLGKVLTILVIVHGACAMFLHVLMFAAPYMGNSYYDAPYLMRSFMNYRGYWIGTIGFWVVLTEIALYYIFFFYGMIESRGNKIYTISSNGSGRTPRQEITPLGLYGVCGMCAGQRILLQGRTVTIGSAPGVTVIIPVPYVSRQHCAVRFNTGTGYYEVYDNSSNGVYLAADGTRLKQGTYNSLQRGSIICVGNREQQFRLM